MPSASGQASLDLKGVSAACALHLKGPVLLAFCVLLLAIIWALYVFHSKRDDKERPSVKMTARQKHVKQAA